jgi:DNA-binding transcriptional regulator YhcF (GntR family)
MRKAIPIIENTIQKLTGMGLNEEEIRRLFESRLNQARSQ